MSERDARETDQGMHDTAEPYRGSSAPVRTRVFRSGNSQAVRIPAELAYGEEVKELEISRVGDVITIRPVSNNLRALVERLRRMPKPDTIELLERTEVPEREWD